MRQSGEREAGLLGHCFGQPVLRGVRAGPAAAGEGGGDGEEGAHGGRGAGKAGAAQGGWGVSMVDRKSGRLELKGLGAGVNLGVRIDDFPGAMPLQGAKSSDP